MRNAPTTTTWLLGAVDQQDEPVLRSVFLITSKATRSKGTSFLLDTGYLITNEHVVRDSKLNDLAAVSSVGEVVALKAIETNRNRDLAVLKIHKPPAGGFKIQTTAPSIGEPVHTWGYPLEYNGPSPILSVGYLAGFNDHRENASSKIVKHYVVNGAFNPGNSGGPLIAAVRDAVIGLVVAKHAPIPQFLMAALEALKTNRSGFQYKATSESGQELVYSESQVVFLLLEHLRHLTQVVIGEAIVAAELTAFLDEKGIPWTSSQ